MVGVSKGSPEFHKDFKDKYGLPFRLLSDEGDEVRRLFQVKSDFFVLPGRETFVIDEKGFIVYQFNNQFQPGLHIVNALDVLQYG